MFRKQLIESNVIAQEVQSDPDAVHERQPGGLLGPEQEPQPHEGRPQAQEVGIPDRKRHGIRSLEGSFTGITCIM